MGQYFTNVKLEFEGSDSEKREMSKLLTIMNKEKECSTDAFNAFPISIKDSVENAIFGSLEDRNGEEVSTRYIPDFNLEKAPQLFAKMFPNSKFKLETEWEYSAGGGTTLMRAIYDGNELKISECQTMEDLSDEEQEEFEEMDYAELEEMLLNRNGEKVYNAEMNADYIKSFYDGNDLANEIK